MLDHPVMDQLQSQKLRLTFTLVFCIIYNLLLFLLLPLEGTQCCMNEGDQHHADCAERLWFRFSDAVYTDSLSCRFLYAECSVASVTQREQNKPAVSFSDRFKWPLYLRWRASPQHVSLLGCSGGAGRSRGCCGLFGLGSSGRSWSRGHHHP